MTTLRINPSDPTPPFEQVRKQLVALIDSGELTVGQRLPTVRQLASDLGVAPGTVSRAFKELESAGYIETRRAAGTRVRRRNQPGPPESLMSLAEKFINDAQHLGASDAQIVRIVDRALSAQNVASNIASR